MNPFAPSLVLVCLLSVAAHAAPPRRSPPPARASPPIRAAWRGPPRMPGQIRGDDQTSMFDLAKTFDNRFVQKALAKYK